VAQRADHAPEDAAPADGTYEQLNIFGRPTGYASTWCMQQTAMSLGGALAAPVTAYQYDWNMLPIGQVLWLKELETYREFPPLQSPATYNLEAVEELVRSGSGRHRPIRRRRARNTVMLIGSEAPFPVLARC
jgi:hypothetical protein